MKRKIRFVLLACFSFFSCSHREQKPPPEKEQVSEAPAAKLQETASFPKGQVIASVTCSNDASQSYALYLPAIYTNTIAFPVIIFFDPHGDGSLPLSRYRSLADKFGFVMIGSNSSKNGITFDQTNSIAENLIREASTRFSIDVRRISLAGFSGGAKVALVAASIHPGLLSVIYCGAAVPFDNMEQLPPALGFAGLRDMNYVEVGKSSGELYEKKIFHALIEWKGKHEWPDSMVFEDAFYWCQFNAMRNKTIPVDEQLVKVFSAQALKSLRNGQNAIDQVNSCTRVISFLDGLADVSSFQNKLQTISASSLFKEEMQKRQNLFQTESSMKSNYSECFESKDLSWWSAEIHRIKNARGEQEIMYQRLLGFLSLASYTYSNSAIRQNNFSSAKQFLAIYKLADPENSEQPFLEACLLAREGNNQQAIVALREAIRLGLHDKQKIETEESFSTLRSDAEFNGLLGQL